MTYRTHILKNPSNNMFLIYYECPEGDSYSYYRTLDDYFRYMPIANSAYDFSLEKFLKGTSYRIVYSCNGDLTKEKALEIFPEEFV